MLEKLLGIKKGLKRLLNGALIGSVAVFFVSSKLSGDMLAIYNDCYFNFEGLGDSDGSARQPILVGQNVQCHSSCLSSCRTAFLSSVTANSGEEGSERLDQIIESTLYNCLDTCKKGIDFSAPEITVSKVNRSYNDGTSQQNYTEDSYIYGKIRTVGGCSTADKGDVVSVVNAGNLKKSQDIIVRVDYGKEHDNQIYSCGRRRLTIQPTYPNISALFYDVTTTANSYYNRGISGPGSGKKYYASFFGEFLVEDGEKIVKLDSAFIDRIIASARNAGPTPSRVNVMWCPDNDVTKCNTTEVSHVNPRYSHPCYASMNDVDWQNMSGVAMNECLTDSSGNPVNTDKCRIRQYLNKLLVPERDIHVNNFNCYPEWHVNNPNLVDTGIEISDGDKLVMSWAGDIIYDNSSEWQEAAKEAWNVLTDTCVKKFIQSKLPEDYRNDYIIACRVSKKEGDIRLKIKEKLQTYMVEKAAKYESYDLFNKVVNLNASNIEAEVSKWMEFYTSNYEYRNYTGGYAYNACGNSKFCPEPAPLLKDRTPAAICKANAHTQDLLIFFDYVISKFIAKKGLSGNDASYLKKVSYLLSRLEPAYVGRVMKSFRLFIFSEIIKHNVWLWRNLYSMDGSSGLCCKTDGDSHWHFGDKKNEYYSAEKFIKSIYDHALSDSNSKHVAASDYKAMIKETKPYLLKYVKDEDFIKLLRNYGYSHCSCLNNDGSTNSGVCYQAVRGRHKSNKINGNYELAYRHCPYEKTFSTDVESIESFKAAMSANDARYDSVTHIEGVYYNDYIFDNVTQLGGFYSEVCDVFVENFSYPALSIADIDLQDVEIVRKVKETDGGIIYPASKDDPSLLPIYADNKIALIAYLYPSGFYSVDARKQYADAEKPNATRPSKKISNVNKEASAISIMKKVGTLRTSVGNFVPDLVKGKKVGDIDNFVCYNGESPVYMPMIDKDNNGKVKKFLGLDSTVTYPTLVLDSSNSNDYEKLKEKSREDASKIDCTKIRDPGLPRYTYSGVLSGVGQKTKFKIGYNNNIAPPRAPKTGGHEVSIDWSSSGLADGRGLQYAFAPGGDRSKLEWFNASFDQNDEAKIVFNHKNDSDLLFRIDPSISKSKCNVSEQSGFYMLNVAYEIHQHSILYRLVTHVLDTLYGKGACQGGKLIGNDGTVPRIYNATTEPLSRYVGYMVTFFLLITSVGFMLGIVKLNQREFVLRVVKISFVVGVTTASSWKVIGDPITNLTVCGGVTLAAKFTPSITFKNGEINYGEQSDPLLIFDDLSHQFSAFTSTIFSHKFWTLLFNGLMCFCIAIIILYSLVKMLFIVVKVLLMYLITLISIGSMIIVVPFVSTMILFQRTKHLFDSTMKYLIMFTILPAATFTAYSLFNVVIIELIIATFNFTVCNTCLISIQRLFPILKMILGEDGLCVMHGGKIIFDVHTPDGVLSNTMFVPVGVAAASFSLLSMTYVASGFLDSLSNLLYRLIGVAAVQAGDGSSGIQGAADSMMKTAGVDAAEINPAKQKGALQLAPRGAKMLYGKAKQKQLRNKISKGNVDKK